MQTSAVRTTMVVTLLSLFLAGCPAEDPQGDLDAGSCVPGRQTMCTCRDGSPGIQRCQPNAKPGPCQCGGLDSADAIPSRDAGPETFDGTDSGDAGPETFDGTDSGADPACRPPDEETASGDYLAARCSQVDIDGSLAEWRDLPTITYADSSGRGEASNSIDARIAWDDRHLYLAYDIQDTELIAEDRPRDEQIWEDDAVELYLDPAHDESEELQADDRQFVINALGSVSDIKATSNGNRDFDWDTEGFDWAVTTQGTVGDGPGDEGFVVEMAISWEAIGSLSGDDSPAAGDTLGIDLASTDRDGSTTETFDWADTVESFGEPDAWYDLALAAREGGDGT